MGQGEGDQEPSKEESSMPKWLERQLEKETPAPKDSRVRQEAILA